tara:strand:+ start:2527 stop:2760 length:234 start_codon:yes stop_codon:yes gene_type:complete
MGKKKKSKSKSKSIWDRIRSNPGAMTEMLAGFGDMYLASKGKHADQNVVPKGQEEAGAAKAQNRTSLLNRHYKQHGR